MKLITLKKLIDAAVEKGHGHKAVYVNKDTFKSNMEEDGHVILPVEGATIQHHAVVDDDGGIKLRKNGEECSMCAFVIFGESYEGRKRG